MRSTTLSLSIHKEFTMAEAAVEETQENGESAPALTEHNDENFETKMTCDALCSLSSSPPCPEMESSECEGNEEKEKKRKRSKSCLSACPKQLQLPMFLSSKSCVLEKRVP